MNYLGLQQYFLTFIGALPSLSLLLISWLNFFFWSTTDPRNRKSLTISIPLLSIPKLCNHNFAINSSAVITFVFLQFSFNSALALSVLTFISSYFMPPLFSASNIVSFAYLKLLMILLLFFTPPSFITQNLLYVLHRD